MLGASRKSFIAQLTGAPPGSRLPGSLAAALVGAAQGVQMLRVHDVAETRQALAVWLGGSPGREAPEGGARTEPAAC
jgi:dihydropteroate synthase